jgi:biotin carboxyl carrier protein
VKLFFDHNSESFSIDLTPAGKAYRIDIGDKTIEAEILQAKDGRLDLLIDGERISAYVSSDHSNHWVTVNGQTFVLTKSSGARKRGHGSHHAAGELTAPMPGQIRAVKVNEGDVVTKGQTLLVLEAMKMEIRIHAPGDGRVKELFVKKGQTVEREQVLMNIVDTSER